MSLRLTSAEFAAPQVREYGRRWPDVAWQVSWEDSRRILGGEGGIRTPEPLRVNGFQDRRIQPLCHLSA
jgi:hypothetical protein